jgi:Cu(I)/Ag(I) efflux system membrane fusion protein
MKIATTLLSVAALAAIGVGGFWLGTRWAHVTSDASSATAAAVPASDPTQRKILHYRNPMGLADTSPIPKKDPMGMDYIPVYEDEADSAASSSNEVRISPDKVQKLGVRTEPVSLRNLGRTVRAAGRIEPDERRVVAISPKFEGYVERLYVNVTGQPVSKGQPLFDVYSPELVSAQREYLIAVQGMQAMNQSGADAGGMKQLAEAGLARLRNWDLPPDQLAALVKSGEAARTVTFRSPVSGIVTEKKALQGMRFMPGDALYQVTDLSSVWVVADVAEQDIGLIHPGARATVKVTAYPEKPFGGTITYVYPTLKAETRSVPVRVELPNPGQLLKTAMFAQVEIPASGKAEVLAVPDSAVIDSGMRRLVLVQVHEGRFEPREVTTGARSDNYVEVREGLGEGEQVVVAANFLIDAESNLKAAVAGLGTHASHGGAAAAGASDVPRSTAVSYQGEGKVVAVDANAGTVTLNHGAIPSLRWPPMTMAFKVANAGVLQGVTPGGSVIFEFVERRPGDWIITSIKPASSHSGHSGH